MLFLNTIQFKYFATLLYLFPLTIYMYIFINQYKLIDNKVYRLQVLTLRTALFLPCYAIVLYVNLLTNGKNKFNEFFISITEGLSFVSFFALFIHNLGGVRNTIKFIETQKHPFLFECFAKNIIPLHHVEKLYKRVSKGLKLILFYRPIIILIPILLELLPENIINNNVKLFKIYTNII